MENKIKMADFKQAQKWLKQGLKICRPCWKPRTFWILGPEQCILCNHNNTDTLKLPHIHLDQLNATDWKIYDEKRIELIKQLESYKSWVDKQIKKLKELK